MNRPEIPTTPVRRMTRQQLIDELMWNDGNSDGHGLCAVGHGMRWALDRPSHDRPDLKSHVSIAGPPEKYSLKELSRLVTFHRRQTTAFDRIDPVRRGSNLICIEKEKRERYLKGRRLHYAIWRRKRLSWTVGPMYSDCLSDALITFKRDR